MPNIYEKDKQYYIKDGDGYTLCDVLYKNNTIVFMVTDIKENNLEDPIVYSYKELKEKLLKPILE